MRILQVVSYYPPALSFGGPPQVMFDLGKALTARGHAVAAYTTDVATIDNWKARIEKKDDSLEGVSVHRFGRMRCGHSLPTKFLKFLVTGLDKSRTEDMKSFDIVHISEITHPLAVRCSSRANEMGIPYVVSIFGNLSSPGGLPRQALRGVFERLWARRMLGNAAALLVQTPHEGELCSRYTSGDRISLMPLPVDMSLFRDVPPRGRFRGKYGIGEEDKVVLFLGRIHQYKGVQLLVEAFAGLLSKGDGNFRLVIAGTDEGYRDSLVRQIAGLGIADRVIFTGAIFGRDKMEAYVDADVFVTTPTNYEETSLAALEACACGTPVIVTERNTIPKLEEYEAGFQISYDKAGLENALLKVLDSSELQQRMGRNARRLIEQEYALEKVAGKLESLFLGLVRPRAT